MSDERRRAWDGYVNECLRVIFYLSEKEDRGSFATEAALLADALLEERDKRFPVEAQDDDHNHDFLRGRSEGYEAGYADGRIDAPKVEGLASITERLRIAALAREWAKEYRDPPRRDFAAQVLDTFASHLESEQP